MKPFPLELRLKYIGPGRRFCLTQPFAYSGEGIYVLVPAGTCTDFASIPKALHWILDPFEQYAAAAVVHDYMYRTRCRSRIVADATFLEMMKHSNVPAWQRWIIYLSVRGLGWLSYKDRRKRKR